MGGAEGQGAAGGFPGRSTEPTKPSRGAMWSCRAHTGHPVRALRPRPCHTSPGRQGNKRPPARRSGALRVADGSVSIFQLVTERWQEMPRLRHAQMAVLAKPNLPKRPFWQICSRRCSAAAPRGQRKPALGRDYSIRSSSVTSRASASARKLATEPCFRPVSISATVTRLTPALSASVAWVRPRRSR